MALRSAITALSFATAWLARSGAMATTTPLLELEAARRLLQRPGDELVGGELGLFRLLHRSPAVLSMANLTTAFRFVRHLANRSRR